MIVRIQARGDLLDELQIQAIEDTLGVTLPKDYRQFLLGCNIGVPEKNQVITAGVTTSVHVFFGVSDNRLHDLVKKNQETYFGRLPAGVLAIAACAGGNLICLQLETGAVFFWDHEEEASPDEPTYENMEMIAPSFDRFLNAIEPFNPEDFPELQEPVKGGVIWKAPGFDEKFKDYLIKK